MQRLLGATLVEGVKEALSDLRFPELKFLAWSDSTIVLSWLAQLPEKWKTFVRNRVSKIQNTMALHKKMSKRLQTTQENPQFTP